MPSNQSHRRQTRRRQDVMKVTIEDVNLDAQPFPVAQGRDRRSSWGLFDIDLSHGVGGNFPDVHVGEVWWIKRSIGSRWVLDSKVDPTRTSTGGGSGGDGGDDERAGIPGNVDLSFNVREKKTALEYSAFVTFDAVITDEDGNPQNTSHYIINWVPTSKNGNIIAGERIRQHTWHPNDAEIDEPDDEANEYYVILPGNVPRPKRWYWKARVRAVSEGNHKGEWSDWTDPTLPVRDSLPEPPAPSNVALRFKWKDSDRKPVFSAVTRFHDVNYWDIPGFDYEDDVTEYQVQLMPLDKTNAWISGREYRKGFAVLNDGNAYICIKKHTSAGGNEPPDSEFWYEAEKIEPGDGDTYVRADPNGDGEPWEIRRKKVKDKDDDDTFVTLGTLAEGITGNDTEFNVDETGVDGSPSVPFVVQTSGGEKWLVTSRTNVGGNVYLYEVFRQFQNTTFSSHLNGENLEWLKDPFVYKVDFSRLERPKTVYWRTRVRSKDRFNRLGPWSDWTLPETPWQGIDWQVPKPVNLRADIQIREYKTHPEYRLVAKFRDPAPNGFNLPGGDDEDELHHYIIVAEALLPDPDGYIEGGDGNMYRYADRKVGVLANPVNPADTSIDITLDSDLPPSFKRIIDRTEQFYLRITTTNPEDPTIVGHEVVAADGVDEPSNTADLSRTLTVERSQKGTGDHGHNAGDEVYLIMEHLRRRTVHDKDESDPGKFNAHYTVSMGHINHAGRLWWRVRGRSVDGFGHRSDWTDWTDPVHPESDPDLIINPPNFVRLLFDRVHRGRWNRWRAIVEFDEVDYVAPDGDREPDVARYAIQLATTDGDELDVEIDDSQTEIFVREKRRAPNEVPFNIMIDDEFMRVTDREDNDGGLWTYTVERGHRNTTAAPHVDGARIYEFPFFHKTVSAKQDDDPNGFNRVAFPRAQKFRHYKARVRAVDRFNRRSEWSDWTLEGTPADNNPPPKPKNVQIDVDNHKIVAEWDYDFDADDEQDPDLSLPSDEAAYFQVQLATQANFAKNSIIRKDRYVAATRKTFRVKKPRGDTFYFRVRAVDGSGNKSGWASTSAAQNGVPTPQAPTITYDTNEETKKLRALVLLDPGVTGIDDDVDGYEFQLQPAEVKKIMEPLTAGETDIDVNDSTDTPNTPFTAYIRDEEVTVTNKAGNTWTATRGVNGSTAVAHRERARIQYFRPGTKKRRRKTGEESEVDDPVLAIYGNIKKGRWYRARVRAHDTKGRWGLWSDWS